MLILLELYQTPPVFLNYQGSTAFFSQVFQFGFSIVLPHQSLDPYRCFLQTLELSPLLKSSPEGLDFQDGFNFLIEAGLLPLHSPSLLND